MIRSTRLTMLSLLLVSGTVYATDPFDGMTLSVARGAIPGDVNLQWSGGQPTFKVHRAASPSGVVAPANLIGVSSQRSWIDSPPPGAAWFYVVTSPCVYNPPEICNGVDDNCDGTVDEDNPGGGNACSTGLPGVCSPGVTECASGQLICAQGVPASAEICDELDNDCDGLVDEGNPGGGAACNTGHLGVCAAGTTACSAGQITCNQNTQGSAETCDGLDNDCDGQADSPPPPCSLPHAAATCADGICAVASCDPGFGNCNGLSSDGCETDLASDAANCGGCGAVCSGNHVPSATCSSGVCNGACAAGFGDCNGNKQTDGCETNLASDAANCGGCGAVCSGNHVPSATCSSGVCNGVCEAGFGDCNGNRQTDGCETDLASDAANCGGCGAACSGNHVPSATCSSGVCNGACQAGFGDCNGNRQTDGCETNLASDAANCGGCGAVCSGNHVPSATCSSGVCNGACQAGFGDCNGNRQTDGCETDLASDAANCGGCGAVCSGNHVPSATCSSGVCNGACQAGFGDCNGNRQTDGCETNLASDAANCGGCGAVCSGNHVPSATCSSGVCNGACQAGFGDCNGNRQTDGCETDLASDAANCGGCSAVCSGNHVPSATCSSGVCNGVCEAGFGDCNGNRQTDGCETDLASDAANCGGCSAVCSGNHVPSATCSSGVCNGVCEAGFGDCNGNRQTDGCETNLASDAANCGGCGAVCSGNHVPSATCSSGVCNGVCEAGFGDCNGNRQTDGCETDLASDAANCGGCSAVCSGNHVPSATCSSGVCNGVCEAGFGDCNGNRQTDGCETNLASDAANCGGCGAVCSGNHVPSATCSSGVCNGACQAGFGDCNGNRQTDGCETDLASDAANCGGCGAVCSGNHVPSATCSSGVCNGACQAGFGDCNGNRQTDGCETNLASDAANCGGCGAVCSGNHVPSATCSSGVCNGACQAGFGDCNGNRQTDGCETNLASDAANCGGCGAVCSGNHVPSATCSSGVCNGVCQAGFGDCNGNRQTDGCETDLASDAANCGGCGAVCSGNHVPSATCSSGVCNGACAAGFGDCNGNKQTDGCETNLASDAANCGGCGAVCSGNHVPSATCSSGVCNGACQAGFGDCNGNRQTDGCETNLASDAANCGGCGAVCSGNHVPSATCSSGVCNGACQAGFGDCNGNRQTDGCETDLASDAANCGGCGAACSGNHVPSATCSSGVCNGACQAGFGDCNGNRQTDGCETDLASDAANCGGCGAVCSGNHVPSATCSSGVCNGACQAGFGDCNGNRQTDGCETDLASDAANCGGCGAVCSGNHVPSATCSSGVCNGACQAGFGDCNGNRQSDGCETDLASDAANCGGCEQSCESGAVCASGACTAAVCSAAPLWTFAISGSSQVRTASSSAPTAAALVYLAQDATLYAVRRSGGSAGSVSWTWTDPTAGTIQNFASPVPLSSGGEYLFLTTSGGVLYKINAVNGAQSWSVDTKRASCSADTLVAPPTVQLYSFSNPAFRADMDAHGRADDDLVFVTTRDQCGDTTSNRIIAHYSSDGVVKWQLNADLAKMIDYGSDGCALDYASSRIYCGTEQTAGRFQNTLWSVNTIDGTLLWSQNAGPIRSRPQLANGNLYVAMMSGVVSKWNATSGSAIWSVPVGGPGVSITRSPWPEFRGGSTGIVLAVDSTGTLHAIHDAGATATKIWSTAPGATFTTMPVVVPSLGKVFVGRSDGYLQQFDLANGHLDASILVGPGPVLAPALELDLGGPDIDRLTVAAVGAGSGMLRRFCIPWVNGTGAPPQQSPCTSVVDCTGWATECTAAACQSALGVCYAAASNESSACTNNLGCAGSSACGGGVCVAASYAACACAAPGDRACSTGTTCCGAGNCVSLGTDPANCGGCGHVCGSDQVCSSGACKRNTSACQATSASTLNALSGTLRGVNDVAFDRQGGFCNAYLSGMGGVQASKLYKVDPTGLLTSWTSPAVDLSPVSDAAVFENRYLLASIANEVSGVPPSYNPGALFVDTVSGSPLIPLTSPKTYSSQPFTIEALNQGPIGPAIDTLSGTTGIGGARGFTAYFANWSTNGDLASVKRDCSIVPSCSWSVGPVPGWALPPGERITAIAFGVPPVGHRSLYIAHGTRLDVYDTALFVVSRSVDLAQAYTPVPGSGATVVKSIRDIAVDPLYGDLYVEIGDLGLKSQMLMMRIDDFSVRNVQSVELDLGATPVAPATFTTEGRVGLSAVKAMRIVPTAPGSTVVSTTEFGVCP